MMKNMQFMLLLLSLVAVACANPQFTPTHFGSSRDSGFNNHGSSNSTFSKDPSDRSADDASSSSGGNSMHSQNFGRPSSTDGTNPSSSSSFGGSSSFSSSAGKPFAHDFSSNNSGAGVGGSGSSGFVDSSGRSDSASDVHFSHSNPSHTSGSDAASPFGSSGSSSGFGSGSANRPSVFHSSGAAEDTTKTDARNDATTEATSSGSTFKFEMLLLFGLAAVACAVPQFNLSHFGSSGFSSVHNLKSINSSSDEDSADDSSSSCGGSSMHTLNFGKPSITDDAKPLCLSFPAHHLLLRALPADEGRRWEEVIRS